MNARVILTVLAACGLASGAFAQRSNQPDKPGNDKPGNKAPAQPATPTKPDKADKPGAAQPDAEMQKAMEAMEAAGKPGDSHKQLAQLVGEWDAVVKWRMGPDAPWTESQSGSTNQMWYDGRYLHQSFWSDMQGMPFKGTAITGYNNMTKEFEAVWVDNMSTGIMFMTGKADAAGKVLTFTGESADPMQGGKKKRTREVTTINSPDKHTSEFSESGPNGKDFTSMTIVYTRKGKGSANPDPAAKPGKDDPASPKVNN